MAIDRFKHEEVCDFCGNKKSEDLIFLGAKFCSAKCEADKAEAVADYEKSRGMIYHNPSTRGKSIEAVWFAEETPLKAIKKKYQGEWKPEPVKKKENGDFDLGFKTEPLDLKDENEYWRTINQGIANLQAGHDIVLPPPIKGFL